MKAKSKQDLSVAADSQFFRELRMLGQRNLAHFDQYQKQESCHA
jgi:hypothetical protein